MKLVGRRARGSAREAAGEGACEPYGTQGGQSVVAVVGLERFERGL